MSIFYHGDVISTSCTVLELVEFLVTIDKKQMVLVLQHIDSIAFYGPPYSELYPTMVTLTG